MQPNLRFVTIVVTTTPYSPWPIIYDVCFEDIVNAGVIALIASKSMGK